MKFNLINYILETVSMILMLVFKEEVIILLYLLANSCGTPLVYYLGIEENRKQAQEYFRWWDRVQSTSRQYLGVHEECCRSNVRIFKRRRVSPTHSDTIMDSPDIPSLKLEDLEIQDLKLEWLNSEKWQEWRIKPSWEVSESTNLLEIQWGFVDNLFVYVYNSFRVSKVLCINWYYVIMLSS